MSRLSISWPFIVLRLISNSTRRFYQSCTQFFCFLYCSAVSNLVQVATIDISFLSAQEMTNTVSSPKVTTLPSRGKLGSSQAPPSLPLGNIQFHNSNGVLVANTLALVKAIEVGQRSIPHTPICHLSRHMVTEERIREINCQYYASSFHAVNMLIKCHIAMPAQSDICERDVES